MQQQSHVSTNLTEGVCTGTVVYILECIVPTIVILNALNNLLCVVQLYQTVRHDKHHIVD